MKKTVDGLNKEELMYSEDIRPLYHKNCAEILLMAANEKYGLGLDNRFLKAVRPFGGGIQSERTCGALLGAVAALGVMFSEDRPCSNAKLKAVTQEFVSMFEDEFGSLDCSYICEHHRSETEGCSPVKLRVAELFEGIVEDALK